LKTEKIPDLKKTFNLFKGENETKKANAIINQKAKVSISLRK
jgi:hypothetical protein